MNFRDKTQYPQQYAQIGDWTYIYFPRDEDLDNNFKSPAEDREIASGSFEILAVLNVTGGGQEYVILADVFQSHPDMPEIRCFFDRDTFILTDEEFEAMDWVRERYPRITLGKMPNVLDHLKAAIKQFAGLYDDSPEERYIRYNGVRSRRRLMSAKHPEFQPQTPIESTPGHSAS